MKLKYWSLRGTPRTSQLNGSDYNLRFPTLCIGMCCPIKLQTCLQTSSFILISHHTRPYSSLNWPECLWYMENIISFKRERGIEKTLQLDQKYWGKRIHSYWTWNWGVISHWVLFPKPSPHIHVRFSSSLSLNPIISQRIFNNHFLSTCHGQRTHCWEEPPACNSLFSHCVHLAFLYWSGITVIS